MKHAFTLGAALTGFWLLWSGHFRDPWLLCMGLLSVILCVALAVRMRITDEEGTPMNLGLRPLPYAGWLVGEVVKANLAVSRLILDTEMPISPRLICVRANAKTPLGRVILANSITLTPGTVSVDLQGDRIWVHALSFAGAEEDLSGEMDRRVCALEG